MNCIAIDDEPLALNIIKDFCSKISYLNLIGICSNGMDGVALLHQHKVDLIFLDIQMPHITGLEFCKSISCSNPPLIIFTTAYTEHALEGFNYNAVDYLIKPFPFERFFKAVNKAYELTELRKKNNPVYINSGKNEWKANYMMIKCEYSTLKVNFNSILYIEGLKDYVKIFTEDSRYLTKSTMKNIESKLPKHGFMRVHKSFIVSISKIQKIENNRILFGDVRIPVGDQFKKAFQELINKFRL